MRSHAKAISAIAAIGCAIFLCFAAPASASAPTHPELPSLSHPGGTLGDPCGAAADADGNLYVSTYNGAKIKIYGPTGASITEFSTSGIGGEGPCGISVDPTGNVYITRWGQDVFKYATSTPGEVVASTTYAPDTSVASGTGQIAAGTGSAVDPETGHVYIAQGDHIAEYESDGTLVSNTIGSSIAGASYYGVDVYGKNGDVYVTDKAHSKVFVFDSTGATVRAEFDGSDSEAGAFNFAGAYPYLAVDQSNAHVYVADVNAHQVVNEFDAAGHFVSAITHSPALAESEPSDIAVDNSGGPTQSTVYVTSGTNFGNVYAYGPLAYAKYFRLKAKKAGTGTGTITSSPAGINCGSVCEASFEEGLSITLIATPSADAGFASWSGCDSVSGNECTVGMSADREATATFSSVKLKVAKTGNGKGTITSSPAGINCGSVCEANFGPGTEVTLTAAPEPGSGVKAWSGCDDAAGNECTVALGAASTVGVELSAKPSIVTHAARPHDTTATLTAQINPNGETTTYQFEYLSQSQYEADGESFAAATKVPASPGAIGDGSQVIQVSHPITGLVPQSTYRYRITASNSRGEVEADAAFTTYLPPQVFDPCPSNDVFRVNRPAGTLPDCRAYEQVTPPNKNGGNAQSEFFLNKASPSGDRISFEAVAGLPGGAGSQTIPTYVASREEGRWSTQGLLPPASSGEQALVIGWTSGFEQVFSIARRFGAGATLLSRLRADGSLATISPYNTALRDNFTNVRYVGSSADGSQAFFDVIAQLSVAPGSPTPAPGLVAGAGEQKNLYAWNRETGQLYFAGALPDGSAPPKGEHAGAVGGGSDDSYHIDTHVVAEDGSVYFTDLATRQLYRRLNPTEPETTNRDVNGDCIPDPALACTVHVSASEKTDGGGLNGHDAAGSQTTKFMASSTDGTKAIFTSSEKLTNSAYTGIEPEHPAAIARAEIGGDGDPELGWLPLHAQGIAVDSEHIYWANPGADTIGRADINGNPTSIDEAFIAGADNPRDVAVDSEHIYWVNAETEEKGAGTIGRADISGNPASVDQDFIDAAFSSTSNPQSIAVDSTHIYWANYGPTVGGASTNEMGLIRADLEGNGAEEWGEFYNGKPEEEAGISQPSHFRATDLTVAGDEIYFIRHGGSDNDPTSDGTGIWHQSLTDPLRPFGGFCTYTAFCDSNSNTFPAAAVVVRSEHIYWASNTSESIGRMNLDGGERNHSFISGTGHPYSLAADGSHLYWSVNQVVFPNAGNDIYAYDSEAPGGQRLTDLASEHDGQNGVEVQGVLGASADASYVYFVANGVPDGPIANSPNARNEEPEDGNCKGSPTSSPSGSCNLYVAHDGEISFIARLNAADKNGNGESTSDSVNWITSEHDVLNTTEKTARVSPDGRTLLFRSQRQLTSYDNEGPECLYAPGSLTKLIPGLCLEIYRYRVGEPGLTCVSCSPTGSAPKGFASLSSITVTNIGATRPAPILSRNLSASGNQVFFETPDPLVAEDTNGDEVCDFDESYPHHRPPSCQDVYEWEAAGAGSCPESAGQQGCIYLLSAGKSPHPSFFADASTSGDDAFVFTFSELVRQDEDDLLDVYDARVGGGLISQDALPVVPCEGEACKGGRGPAAQSPSAGTQSFAGAGDPRPVHKKAKKHRKKRRHAKRGRHGKHHRAAKTTGRASR